MTDKQKYGIYKNTGEAVEAWSGDYITSAQLRNLAQKVNRGIKYALSTSKKSNISNYTLYRDLLPQVMAHEKMTKISTIIKNVNKKTGEFQVTTSFKNYSNEERRIIAGLLDYLGQNWAISKTNWEYKQQEIARKSKSTFLKKHARMSLESYEMLESLFKSSFWNAIRYKAPYTEQEMFELKGNVNKLLQKTGGEDELMRMLSGAASVSDLINQVKAAIKKNI